MAFFKKLSFKALSYRTFIFCFSVVCLSFISLLLIACFYVQACARNTRRSKEFYGQLATCEIESHSNISRPKDKGIRSGADYEEGATLLQNEFCDYEDDELESEEDDVNVLSRGSTVRT